MPRYALKIEYDGTPFSGWQRQKDHPSVQAAIETALRRIDPAVPSIAAAGRTDAGVHAFGQVAQADMSREWVPFRLAGAVNFHLKPLPVAVVAVARVNDDWHARFSAVERRYLFRLLNRRAPAALQAGKVWQVSAPLELEAMQEAARHLLGLHDFTTFRASECQADSPVRTLDQLDIERVETPMGPEFQFHVRARSFLHNQVRSFVGSLERVGAGAWSPDDLRHALEARDRAACGPVCPPHGLYLAEAIYPTDPFAETSA